MHWKDKWEDGCGKNREELDAIPVEELLDRIKNEEYYSSYNNIWYSIAKRGDLKSAGWIFFDLLNRDIDYLQRAHCATALLDLMENSDFTNTDLSSENYNYKENLKIIKKLLEEKIGVRR